jgi:hypothetical protein
MMQANLAHAYYHGGYHHHHLLPMHRHLHRKYLTELEYLPQPFRIIHNHRHLLGAPEYHHHHRYVAFEGEEE